MDYKEKYEEAFERAKDIYNDDPNSSTARAVCEQIFPELEESEDEKIRKEILNVIHQLDDNTTICGRNYDFQKWISWLEKQGELVNSLSKGLDNAHERIDGLIQKNNSLIEQLEKQGEQPNPYSGISFEYDGHIWGMCARDNGVDILLDKQLFKHLEKQGEQKSTDKTEPKFKVGDWLQYRNAKPFFVEEITKQGYVNGDSCLPFNWENEINLWTIRDAKDGDVLCYEDEVFILKNYVLFHKIVYHCCYDGKNLVSHSIYSLTKDDFNKIHPATEEQRDLLFSKMKEAGYEWDAEKKEWRKIEQKSAWSEEDEKHLFGCINYFSGITESSPYYNDYLWLESLKERMKGE